MKKTGSSIPLFLAPMAGFTDQPFRRICKFFGADVLITEMVSSKGIIYDDQKTFKLLEIKEDEHPVGVQLFGSDPLVFSEAIRKIENIPFDFININMGCPAPKIVKNKDGCALMLDEALASAIIKSCVSSTKKPVSIKIRKGWDNNIINAVEFSKMAEESGASAIIIHGRTKEQLYSGKADWDIIRKVKEAVKIPVIGNGDVFSPEDAKRMLEETGCDGIMIGRGALGTPWIFKMIKEYLKSGEKIAPLSLLEKKEIIFWHMKLSVEFYGEKTGIMEFKKHVAWYLKGLYNSTKVKTKILSLKSRTEIEKELKNYFDFLIRG
ncbi:tRNA dihydrouridine synthase DusB [Thermovenabulum sp.]|uniref:tRNA dihydrouridine synthase DusB n=1 Tax=Thermovenabulum sp. TaxID=3100335 RepID=UPI003C79A7E8